MLAEHGDHWMPASPEVDFGGGVEYLARLEGQLAWPARTKPEYRQLSHSRHPLLARRPPCQLIDDASPGQPEPATTRPLYLSQTIARNFY